MDRDLKVLVKKSVQNNERRSQSRHFAQKEQLLLSFKYEHQQIWGGISTRTKSLGVFDDIDAKSKMHNDFIEVDETLTERI